MIIDLRLKDIHCVHVLPNCCWNVYGRVNVYIMYFNFRLAKGKNPLKYSIGVREQNRNYCLWVNKNKLL